MFKINDIVIYGTEGVCKIADINDKDFMGTKKRYYVLKPVKNEFSTFFAPTDSEKVLAKMRRIP